MLVLVLFSVEGGCLADIGVCCFFLSHFFVLAMICFSLFSGVCGFFGILFWFTADISSVGVVSFSLAGIFVTVGVRVCEKPCQSQFCTRRKKKKRCSVPRICFEVLIIIYFLRADTARGSQYVRGASTLLERLNEGKIGMGRGAGGGEGILK